MRICVVAVGRLKSGPERDLCDRYASRFTALSRALGLSGPDVTEIPESQARSVAERKAQEAEAMLRAVPAGAARIRLDEGGSSIDSVAFSGMIAARRDAGARQLCFLIGGADGLGDSLRQDGGDVIGFGRMTLPHQLVRVLLLEQLYRTTTILAGHPYHRA